MRHFTNFTPRAYVLKYQLLHKMINLMVNSQEEISGCLLGDNTYFSTELK